MPTVDPRANARKAEIDTLAADMLNWDQSRLVKLAKKIAAFVGGDTTVRFCITGGAGSGKTSLAGELAEALAIPCFDFDEYIPGGYTWQAKEYRSRLVKGMSNLWDDLPKSGWILEHVEACNEDVVKAFKPDFCIFMDPEVGRLLRTAQARGSVAGDTDEQVRKREQRALESSEYARMQFSKVPGKTVLEGDGWSMKKVG
jgi:hypothetical protein